MKAQQPELSRPVEVGRIPATGCVEHIVADANECAHIAERLDLPAIHSLTADLALSRWRGEGVKVRGTLEASLDQICVVTLERFRADVRDEVECYFLPGGDPDQDVDPLENGIVELGEVVIEALSIALDPYPRKPGAVFEATDEVEEQSPASPFAELVKLRTRKR